MASPANARAKDALLGAAVTLLAFGFCVWRVVDASLASESAGIEPSPMRMALYGIGIAVSLVAHLVFIGIAARAQSRSVVLWVALALLSFPIGSLVALVVMLWLSDGGRPQPQAPPPRP